MRIQHNIMAMSAYRNYTNNVSAMKKNLEKLSSGYKINRAGDDAAGLAISEKMRAQITGLQTAQKNAKDGISLVQTAEGALTEVHDMLNRMVELATQSANGTYDNDTDRYQLQKEMDQLRAEIDRIADSSNFNGIQLLDGSMDAGGDVTYTEGKFQFAALHPAGISTGDITLPPVGQTLGTNSVLHSDAVTGNDTNAFSVDLHNLQLGKDGSIKLTIGTTEFTMAAGATKDMTAADIAKAFVDGATFNDANGTAVDADSVDIGGTKYSVKVEDTRLTFTQLDTDTTTPTIPAEIKVDEVAAAGGGGGGAGTKGGVSVAVAGANGAAAANDGETIVFKSDGATQANLTFTWDNANSEWKTTDTVTGYDVAFDGTNLTLTQTTAADEADSPFGDFSIDAASTFTGATIAAAAGTWTPGVAAGGGAGGGTTTTDKLLTGDYNKSTTVISTKRNDEAERLASTVFTLTDKMTSEGSQITIGRDTYTFTTDKSKIGKDGYVVFNEGDTLATKADLLTKAAENNGTYTVGHQSNGKITITENVGQTNFDLTTMEGIEKSLGFKSATTNPVDNSKGLTLQIGDTADSYNQLKVNIKDCHVKGLGIDNIDISTQDGAAEAVDKIKSAINYVSDVRGTLGATQNRLDHTINNLSVMTENIQDAESTIRDVDVAEEMMAYTKNNILIQSAQAMLAQANQVPQGVLQLLG